MIPKQPVHKFKLCHRCQTMRAPEGGVEMGAGRWSCDACWKRPPKPAKPVSKRLTDDEIEAALGFEPLDYMAGFHAGVRYAELIHLGAKA